MYKLKYSQNFLQSTKLVKKILSLSNINKNDIVYEIGCGKGIITKQLVKISQKVIGIELDINLYKHLKEILDTDTIKLLNMDFLDIHLPTYSYKVFSNIPFTITTQIIRKLTLLDNCPTDSFLIIQKEAALKFMGKFGVTLDSLLLYPFFDFKILYHFQKYDFSPVPKVSVVLLHIQLKKDFLIEKKYYHKYQNFIRYIFTQKCSIIKLNFKVIFSKEQIKRLGKTYNFNMEQSIYKIKPSTWIEIFKFFLKVIDQKR